jgi:hypothetical protein
MAIIVGYVPDAAGEVALARGIEEARLRDTEVMVLHFVRIGIRNAPAGDILELRARMAEVQGVLEAQQVRGTS